VAWRSSSRTWATGTQKRHTNNSVYDSMSSYSPDGMFIVYSRGSEDLDSELTKQNIATGSKTIVTSNNVVDQQADWGVQPTIVP
jgi:Tol biopolymer transport system component